MKIRFVFAISMVVCMFGTASAQKGKKIKLQNATDSVSYAIGVDVARNLAQSGVKEPNVKAFAQGMYDSVDSSLVKIADVEACIQAYFVAMQNTKYAANKDAGEKFLTDNKKNADVVVLPSGLQYKVIKQGTGDKPTADDMVKVHYEGKLIDGRVFDSSFQRDEPATFPVNAVIKGWTESLQLMPVGSTWQLFIPYQLAYGERGAQGSIIEPYATLIFNVELLSIEKE